LSTPARKAGFFIGSVDHDFDTDFDRHYGWHDCGAGLSLGKALR
jgi:hypothetical protein